MPKPCTFHFIALMVLGRCLNMQRKYEAAEQCCLKAVDIESKTHGNKYDDLRAYGELALSVVEDQ